MTWSTIYTRDGVPSNTKLAFSKFEKITNVTREKLFETSTNFQSYQNWMPQYFPSIRVISERPNTTLAEEHRMISGKEMVVMARHIVNDSFTHETFFIGGDAKGSHIIEKYEPLLDGTKISVQVDFRPKISSKLSGLFKKTNYYEEYEQIIEKLIEIAKN